MLQLIKPHQPACDPPSLICCSCLIILDYGPYCCPVHDAPIFKGITGNVAFKPPPQILPSHMTFVWKYYIYWRFWRDLEHKYANNIIVLDTLFFCSFLWDFTYFLERGGGRKKEKKVNINWLPTDQTCNPGMCLMGIKQRPFGFQDDAQPAESPGQGRHRVLKLLHPWPGTSLKLIPSPFSGFSWLWPISQLLFIFNTKTFIDHYFSSSLPISRGLNNDPKRLIIIPIHEQRLVFFNKNTFIFRKVTIVSFVNYEEILKNKHLPHLTTYGQRPWLSRRNYRCIYLSPETLHLG